MTEIWLNFTDEDGYPKRVSVGRDNFVIGRHPDNDLCISDTRLSRQHLQIERFGERITVTDCNSSNGTTLNNEDLFETETLRDGDVLNLGGVEIRVEFVSANEENFAPVVQESAPKIEETRPTATAQSVPQTIGGIPSNFFFIAPLIGLFVLLFIGGLIYVIGGNSDNNPNNELVDAKTPTEIDPDKTPRKTPEKDKTPTSETPPINSGNNIPNTTPTPANSGTTPTPVASSGSEKVKQNATEFMRRIAENDPNPFLKNDQAERVSQKINSLKNSSSLAENLKAIGRDKSQFETLASSKDLKPQFLAAAALNEGGNPVETAKTMLPILGKLKIPLSTDFADDCLLMIAAYNQGKNGDPKGLSQKMEGLSKKLSKEGKSVTTRELRSIWFLKNNGKLTDAEFENALSFLAIGVIMQNPKEFGINAEAVVF